MRKVVVLPQPEEPRRRKEFAAGNMQVDAHRRLSPEPKLLTKFTKFDFATAHLTTRHCQKPNNLSNQGSPAPLVGRPDRTTVLHFELHFEAAHTTNHLAGATR